MAELYFCERMGFQILPDGLVPGPIGQQPLDRLYYWMQIAGLDASQREKLMARRARENRPKR